MRLRTVVTAVASASLVALSNATPAYTPKSADRAWVEPRDQQVGRRADVSANKYFHEPGDDEFLAHYDARFFHGVVSDQERVDTQSHMMRAYLNYFRERGLDTWIAHGTLLGWWWNGQRLPWDYDLDTQVADTTLHLLGEAHNQTKYSYTSADSKVQRDYLLDVNPWIWQRDRGDGMNVIDARWIDTRNGLYIDITGLSQIFEQSHPGIWSCKNYHLYRTEELYPLRETMFEGVMAKVPYNYDKILLDEYTEKALTETIFNGHIWNLKMREWVETEVSKAKKIQDRIDAEEARRKKAWEQEEAERKKAWEQEEAKKAAEAEEAKKKAEEAEEAEKQNALEQSKLD